MHTIHLVAEFHSVFGHPIALHPTTPDADTRLLRFRLIFEELMEYGRAIGVSNLCAEDSTQEEFEARLKDTMAQFSINSAAEVDQEGAADALGDLDYVVQGSNLVHGFPAEEIIRDIHDANMSKLGADGKPIRDPFGKTVKGPNTRRPNTAQILKFARMV